MYVVSLCSSLLVGSCYVQLHFGCSMGIVLFEASIYCVLCCWVSSIYTRRFGIFCYFIFIFSFDFFVDNY